MRKTAILASLVIGAMTFSSVAAIAQGPAQNAATISNPIGTWINPHGTVKVATSDCGGKLCGWVTWASSNALSDAQEAGVSHLVGTELLRDYHGTAQGHWQGQVYVPDMGRTFYSTIAQVDHNQLKISGCVLGGLICKTQIWQRS